MNYREYKLNRQEKLFCLGQAAGIIAITAYCFYDSILFCLSLLIFFPWFYGQKRERLAEQRRQELKLQFKDAMQSIAAALAAGFSMENALREAGRDLELLHTEKSWMVQELTAMRRKVEANQTVEAAMEDFARRSGLWEAETFSEIFFTAKRNGGDLIGIMKNTVRRITETLETEQEIAATLAAKKYELRIMSLIPYGMILYLRTGSGGFLDPLYKNPAGIMIMTGCLGVYTAALKLGKRILNIEV